MPIPYKNPNRYQKSHALFQGSSVLIPGGVNSTARALWAGWEPHPLFITHAEGSHIVDVDGNNYVDYLLGLGAYQTMFVSTAHNKSDIQQTLKVAQEVIEEVKSL